MKRLLAAACAATLLTGGLTACTVRENPVHTNTNGVTNSKIPMDDTTNNNSMTNTNPSDSGTVHSGGTNNSTTDPTTRDSGSVSGGNNNGTTDSTVRGSGPVSGGNNNGTIYPDSSDLARSGYDHMRSNRIWYDGKSDGRYTAYSDGAVSPGGTGNLIQDGKNLGRDLMNGTKNVVDSVRDTVRDLGGVPQVGDVPPYE